MNKLYPDYYEKFKCIADKCPKTCCGGWQIEIDEESLAAYKSMGIDNVDYENEIFNYDEDKMCRNLREDGLCKLILKHGEGILCRTCATFPRHIEEFQNVREYSLSISCPEVARLILNRQDSISFYEEDDEEKDLEDYDAGEQEVYKYLQVLRKKFVDVIQNRNLSLKDRGGLILCIADTFQNAYDNIIFEDGDLDQLDIDSILNTDYASLNLTFKNRKAMFDVMKGWEFTTSEFSDLLSVTEETIYTKDTVSKEKAAMCKCLAGHGVELSVVLEQILLYFIYAYFCGSAYDEFYFGQAQLAVCTCLHIQDLALAHYMRTGDITLDDLIRLTYLYARELEHSIPNILYTEEYMDENPLV